MKNKRFPKISKEFSQLFIDKVKSAKKIIVTSHTSPDDDSISAVLSTYYFITKYLKIAEDKVTICYTGDRSSKWKHFINYDKINFVKDIADVIDGSDLLILLDGSFWNRFSRNDDVSKYKGTTICIDHHLALEPQFNFHLNIVNTTSTAEILYRLFFEDIKLDKNACELLLLGILGDTGNFEFIDADRSEILLIAQKLIVAGKINIQSFKGLYSKIDFDVYKCLTEFMKNGKTMVIDGWPEFMFSYIDESFVKENGLTDNQTSEACLGYMPYLRNVGNAEWGFTATPRLREGTSSISFRSSPGSVNVREIADRMKIGGGHDRAAGGKLKTSNANEALEYIFDWMKKNKPTFS